MWQSLKNIYHLFIAVLANIWFGFPSRRLTVIGVTGTDGKTTTVSLIYHILKEAGFSVSMISSIGATISGKVSDLGFHVTTPSSWALQKFLKKAVQFLVLEVTSHALDQYRVWGIDFAVGVLTNVTNEHLDYHKTYENYVATKAKLLQMAKVAIVNKDDESYRILNSKYKIENIHRKYKKWVTYGLKNNAEINLSVFPFKTKLIGEFNKYNILAAVSACKSLGLRDEDIRRAIESFSPPIGRGEIVYQNSFSVMIDFAHTPNAFEKILSAVRSTVKGRIIHVFGSAGERDRQKRPEMGRISSKYTDVIILTAEDPRSESVDKINAEIVKGIQNSKSRIQNGTLLTVPNRQKAINAAIKMAKKGDLVLTTGKAHEKSMNYGRREESWDEFEAVKKALQI